MSRAAITCPGPPCTGPINARLASPCPSQNRLALSHRRVRRLVEPKPSHRLVEPKPSHQVRKPRESMPCASRRPCRSVATLTARVREASSTPSFTFTLPNALFPCHLVFSQVQFTLVKRHLEQRHRVKLPSGLEGAGHEARGCVSEAVGRVARGRGPCGSRGRGSRRPSPSQTVLSSEVGRLLSDLRPVLRLSDLSPAALSAVRRQLLRTS